MSQDSQVRTFQSVTADCPKSWAELKRRAVRLHRMGLAKRKRLKGDFAVSLRSE